MRHVVVSVMLPGGAKNKTPDTWLCFHFILTTELATVTRHPKIGCNEWWIGLCQSQDYSSHISVNHPITSQKKFHVSVDGSQRTSLFVLFVPLTDPSSLHCGSMIGGNSTNECRAPVVWQQLVTLVFVGSVLTFHKMFGFTFHQFINLFLLFMPDIVVPCLFVVV